MKTKTPPTLTTMKGLELGGGGRLSTHSTAIHDPRGTYLSLFQRVSVCIQRANTINCIMWKLLQFFWRLKRSGELSPLRGLEVRD